MDPIVHRQRRSSMWSALHGVFDDRLTVSLETMVRRLIAADLFAAPRPSPSGAPDGFDGLSRRGPISRMVLSDVVVASAHPDEFIRRLVSGESTYLELAMTDRDQPRRVVAWFDSGIEQLGGARIGQLAAILTLWNLTQRRGAPLEIASLQRPDDTMTGDLRELIRHWLRSRTAAPIPTDRLRDAMRRSGSDDEQWVCCGVRTAAEVEWPAGAEVVTFEEPIDRPSSCVVVQHRRSRITLPLPFTADSVRLLRGEGFRRHGPGSETSGSPIGPLAHPRFGGSSTTVLCRSDEPEVLVAVRPQRRRQKKTPSTDAHTTLYAFAGAVVAAGIIGRRLVVLSEVGDGYVRVETRGRRLRNVDELELSTAEIQLDASDLGQAGPPHPLLYWGIPGSGLYVGLPSGLSEVASDRVWRDSSLVAAAPSRVVDQPVVIVDSRYGGCTVRGPHGWARITDHPRSNEILGNDCAAWRSSAGWVLTDLTTPEAGPLLVQLDAPPIGIVRLDDGPAFVIRSGTSGHVDLVGEKVRSWRPGPNQIVSIDVHPTEPFVVVQLDDRSIVVHDLNTDRVILRHPGAGS